MKNRDLATHRHRNSNPQAYSIPEALGSKLPRDKNIYLSNFKKYDPFWF